MKPQLLNSLPALIGFLILIIFFLAGCSKQVEADYYGSYSSRDYDSNTAPATQKPYRIKGKKYYPIPDANGFSQTGIASWYGKKFHGRKTSNGETYNMYAMTAAHKTLPMETWVEVHNLENGQKIRVRINDRGPFVRGRIIDLSYTGAKKIGIADKGTAKVRVTALGSAVSYAKNSHTPIKFKPMDYWKGNFSVQVGAFKSFANAQSYRDMLARSYQNAHMVTYEDYRGRFYRVRIGHFSNANDAMQFSDRIVERGLFKSAFPVGE